MTTKEYISKDEVEVILKKYHRYSKSLEEIRVLPTFSPEKIIEEVSEDFSYSFVNANGNIVARNPYKKLLNTILERLHAENIS